MTTVKRFEDLKPGDELQGVDGKPVEILRAYDVHTPERMFEITLDDGRSERAGGTHLWYIILDEDWQMLPLRKKALRSFVKKMSLGPKRLLNELAESDEPVEFSYSGLLEALVISSESEFAEQVGRVLESIGPIVEETHESRDLLTDELAGSMLVPIYDSALASRQILSLSGHKRWRKASPALPGRVVDTVELVELSAINEVEIPTQ